MKRFGRALVVALCLAILGSVISLVPQKNAKADGGAPVNIISPLPLPVTGKVDVNNFPSSQNVSFNGAAQPVSFSNTSSKPLFVDLDQPARSTFQMSCDSGVLNSNIVGACAISPSSEVVIETVTAFVAIVTGAPVEQVTVTVNGTPHFLAVTKVGTGTTVPMDTIPVDTYAVTVPIRLYAAADSGVGFAAFGPGIRRVEASVAGHSVNQ